VPHDLFQVTTGYENARLGGVWELISERRSLLAWSVAAQERCSHIENRIFIKAPMDFSSSPPRMKMAGVATVSALCEPWVLHRFHKPTLPANSAVGVATKAGIFIDESARQSSSRTICFSPCASGYKAL